VEAADRRELDVGELAEQAARTVADGQPVRFPLGG
jgi:hypothetical protein